MSRRSGFTIRAVTIDEGIPGYRDEALRIVRDYCGKMDIEYSVLGYEDLYDTTLDEALKARGDGVSSSSSCSLCGVLRRRAIDEASKGADVVATAHNLDDHLQTFVINMLTGDTAKIAWMGPSSGGTPPENQAVLRDIRGRDCLLTRSPTGYPSRPSRAPT